MFFPKSGESESQIDAGEYNPTFKNIGAGIANLQAVGAFRYLKIGVVVRLSGAFSIDFTGAQGGVQLFTFNPPHETALGAPLSVDVRGDGQPINPVALGAAPGSGVVALSSVVAGIAVHIDSQPFVANGYQYEIDVTYSLAEIE